MTSVDRNRAQMAALECVCAFKEKIKDYSKEEQIYMVSDFIYFISETLHNLFWSE